MCPSEDCPARGDCYRNEDSGTRANPLRQSFSAFTWRQPGGIGAPVECDGYWPINIDALPPTGQTGRAA